MKRNTDLDAAVVAMLATMIAIAESYDGTYCHPMAGMANKNQRGFYVDAATRIYDDACDLQEVNAAIEAEKAPGAE